MEPEASGISSYPEFAEVTSNNQTWVMNGKITPTTASFPIVPPTNNEGSNSEMNVDQDWSQFSPDQDWIGLQFFLIFFLLHQNLVRG